MTKTRLMSRAAAVVAVAAMISTVVMSAGTAHAEPDLNVRIQNAETHQYLTIGNGSTSDGAAAIQWTSLSGYEQRWNFTKVEDRDGDDWDLWVIRNGRSGDCLAIPAGSRVNGTGAIQWTCLRDAYGIPVGLDDQRWYVQFDSVLGGYRIVNYVSFKCLAIPGGNTTPGTQAIQWDCANDPDQRWWIF
ncbi:RICIN domain-containing protein [Kribbella sp. NPDC003505]|uniref:RICIN domain-containing protein n=1 Tax=Kribbella sp. NPDC003505 TaxID=3154448 RepID=UPI0033ABE9B6